MGCGCDHARMDAALPATVPSIQRVTAHQVRPAVTPIPDLPMLRAGSTSPVGEGAQFAAPSVASVVCGPSVASVGDYMALMKPRVMSLVVFTALVSVMIAPGHVHPVIGFTTLLCIAVGAGAAAGAPYV